MYYTIYKITNNLNGRYYIGQHRTNDLDDGYMGSGVAIRNAISKHGKESFSKEYLFIFDNEKDMNDKEVELVTIQFCELDETYNLCPGGNSGGFVYANLNGMNNKGKDYSKRKMNISDKHRNTSSENMRKAHADGKIKYDNFSGKSHIDETKSKMSEIAKLRDPEKNSAVGSKWFTNGSKNVRVYPNQEIPEGYYLGRSYAPNLKSNINLCVECKQKEEDLYWWKLYVESGMSVSKFCREIYPFIRQNFYGLKKRIESYNGN